LSSDIPFNEESASDFGLYRLNTNLDSTHKVGVRFIHDDEPRSRLSEEYVVRVVRVGVDEDSLLRGDETVMLVEFDRDFTNIEVNNILLQNDRIELRRSWY
jgi:hypothetical protein